MQHIKRKNCFYKQGNFIILCGGYGSHRFTLSLGPDWKLFVSMWLLCLGFAIYSLYIPQLQARSFRFRVLYYACVFVTVASYLYTGICDAGVITPDEDNSIENADHLEKLSYSYCTICQVYRPPHAAHCAKCGVCFRNMDHHCTFMGQCVARNNRFSFYLFLACIFVLELFHYELDSSIFIFKFTPIVYFYRIFSRWMQNLSFVCNKHITLYL